MFEGFPEETYRFFLDIRFHNSAEYYNDNRERYRREVQAPFYALIDDLAPAMTRIDPQMEIRPYKCLARLRRDTRFTKDKSPYRDHLWITFRRAAEPREGSLCYWFETGPERLNWGMGFWGENPPVMERFRRQLAADPAGVQAVIDSCHLAERGLAVGGREQRRLAVPGNLPLQLAHWYRLRDLYIGQERVNMAWAADRGLYERILADFNALAPLWRLLRGIQDEINAESEAAETPARGDEWE